MLFLVLQWFSIPPEFDELDGTNGFTLNGSYPNGSQAIGWSVSEAGDFNGDGFDDILWAARTDWPNLLFTENLFSIRR